jgi:phage terminase large subunit
MRRVRLYEGKPSQAEGVIYEDWNEAVHYIYEQQMPECSRYIGGQDWGFIHPGVLGIWAIDNDGKMYLVRQVYRTKKTINWWKKRAKELDEEFNLEAIACGPDQPAYIEEYRQLGINAIPADNSVIPGINAVQQRLANGPDGKPSLYIVRDSLIYPDQELINSKRPHKVEDEFPAYVWADKRDKEVPAKKDDDGMDMARYSAMYLDEPIVELGVVRL